jgi:hypothetical protein
MNLTTLELGLEGLDALGGVDALCLFVAEDDRPLPGAAGFVDWRLCGHLSALLREAFFSGQQGERLLLPGDGRLPCARLFVLGLGRRSALSRARLAEVLAEAARVLTLAQAGAVALEVPGAGQLDDGTRAAALADCFLPAFRQGRVTVLAERTFARQLAGAARA